MVYLWKVVLHSYAASYECQSNHLILSYRMLLEKIIDALSMQLLVLLIIQYPPCY